MIQTIKRVKHLINILNIFINEILLNSLSLEQIKSKIYFNPELLNVNKTSFISDEIGYPCRLRLVFKTAGMLVSL